MSTLLEVDGVSVSFDGFRAINNLSIQIGDPELRAVIGPNGAGKTTFMDIITGKTKPDEGRVTWGDKNISLLGLSESQIAREGVGRKFQKPTVFDAQTVRENLAMALRNPRGPFSVLFYKKTADGGRRIEEIADEVGLTQELTRPAGELSHGQKQWLEIAIVMLQDSELMLIDEPAAGMSDVEAEKTGNLLCDLSKKHSVIVIEHDMKFVEQIAIEKVSVLVRGQLLTEGTFQEVRNNQEVIDCYLGSANSAQQKAHS